MRAEKPVNVNIGGHVNINIGDREELGVWLSALTLE